MRVTAGSARGRPLRAPKTALRPTSDKVKQAIFSMLEAEALRRGFELSDDNQSSDLLFAAAQAWPRAIDLFAGSGALGIEALSRGAQWVTFVERDRTACETIRANLAATGLSERGRLLCASVETALLTLSEPHDLVLLDPPYRDESAALNALGQIRERGLLRPEGIAVWEHDRGLERSAEPEGFRLLRSRNYGSTTVTLLAADLSPEHVAYESDQ